MACGNYLIVSPTFFTCFCCISYLLYNFTCFLNISRQFTHTCFAIFPKLIHVSKVSRNHRNDHNLKLCLKEILSRTFFRCKYFILSYFTFKSWPGVRWLLILIFLKNFLLEKMAKKYVILLRTLCTNTLGQVDSAEITEFVQMLLFLPNQMFSFYYDLCPCY